MESDEATLPRATLNAFVKEIISKKIKCSNDLIDIVNQISTQYIKHISAEANKICLNEGKKTITPEFIYKALKSLNFESHLEIAKQAQQQCDEEVQKRNQMRQEFQKNFNQEELQLEQQKIFDESAREFQKQQEMIKNQDGNPEGEEQDDKDKNNDEQMKMQENNLFENKSMDDDEDYEN